MSAIGFPHSSKYNQREEGFSVENTKRGKIEERRKD
jgi:hypothetical protein